MTPAPERGTAGRSLTGRSLTRRSTTAGPGPGGPSTTPARRRRAAAGCRLSATVVVLIAGQAVLWRAGASLPPVPPDADGVARALAEADPLGLAVGLVRLAALAVGAGLLVTTGLGILARCCGAARTVVRLDRWTPPGLRRLLDGALGVGLAATIGLGAQPSTAEADHPSSPPSTTLRPPEASAPTTLRRLPDAVPPQTADQTPPAPAPGAPITLRRLPDAVPLRPADQIPPTPTPGSPVTLRRLPDALPATPAPTAPDGSGGTETGAAPAGDAGTDTDTDAGLDPAIATGTAGGRNEVVVQAGDSFWRLAERHEAERLGRSPTEAEVGACWQVLVAVNRPRLVVPEDADLLFPGQVLIVPGP